ncbi:ATP-dependent helicase [Desulfolutivibrio sulfoxidireducens]|uniref:ATP-dependent helicase n=1 Tax=Desulfolutivibrio sulfoxidireducens TaxID=2773299 RepID=UPI00159E593F|nr:ATP-dependent helicase [Desulfolutivibrio sulfoxidireducens]QLA20852.1 AAA family ATPase [Desulfolutivibrio sulfoxidireducens]
MPITQAQKTLANQKQTAAAIDMSPQVGLVAGPGTGKSHSIENRIVHLLQNGAVATNIYVISFTRAACVELEGRIHAHCQNLSCASAAAQIHVSTMHSLALRILRKGNLLTSYPSTPIILDRWEQSNIYDKELASSLRCKPSRASEIRLAHDTQWQTLNPQSINQAQITQTEIVGFNAFHASRTNLYSCVLPGEVIYKCVEALQQGALQPNQLPQIDHLIVDEFQDLNACDQEFIRLLCANNAVLFIAGDDDQSIYSFRHADPNGIINFALNYPASRTHILDDCFRCTPAILSAANRLIAHNQNRLQKSLVSLYATSSPPVQGQMLAWSFRNGQDEAKAIAESCHQLLNAGMAGMEDEIIILISNRKVQLDLIIQELANFGLPYDPPRNSSITDDEIVRAVYSIIRIVKDHSATEEDYPAHRDIIEVLSGVGSSTAKSIADACIANNQNFRSLFYLPTYPTWLSRRNLSAVQRTAKVVQNVSTWDLNDTLAARGGDIMAILSSDIFLLPSSANALSTCATFIGSLPPQMTLDELIQFLSAPTEADQQTIIGMVNQRVASPGAISGGTIQKRIKILTMHGAKGLSGKVVFIPGAEQGIIPNFKALQATGLVIEQRRLFYVSITRARSCCIVSHAVQHNGKQAMVLKQSLRVNLTRSQFLNEMQVRSVNRTMGLTQVEAGNIVSDINNL